MAETIQSNGLWNIILMRKDLVEQAGLNEEFLSYQINHLKYKDRRMVVSHFYNEHLVVSIEGEEDKDLINLMASFSKVVEYEPFCKYGLLLKGNKVPILPTYEWDKINPDERFAELSNRPNIKNLIRI